MNRLRELRLEKMWLQSYVAELLEISTPAYCFYENKKREIPINTLIKLSNLFNVSIDYLLGRTDIKNFSDSNTTTASSTPNNSTKIPILRKTSEESSIFNSENIDGYEFAPSKYVKDNYEYFYLKVLDDSMNLKFQKNDLILVQKQDFLENGDIGVILVNKSETTIRKYIFQNNFVILQPMSFNTKYATQAYIPNSKYIKIVGKVILHFGEVQK